MAGESGGNGRDTDPNDGKPLENATPDAAGKGILAGYGICSIMSGSMGMTITPGISPTVILAATLFSCAVGVFFGIYPAKKAAKLSPIEALRRN